jgi:hypothetical protein
VSYEVNFYFHDKKEEGGYDTENKQVFTRVIGKGAEDIPLEKLAGVVMAQLARRDVWITDVEVYETVKKKISFKETKGGIILKNKKYSFDQGITSVLEDLEEEEDEIPVLRERQKENPSTKQPLRWEIFTPDQGYIPEIKAKGYPLTVGNKYPIMHEKIISQNVGGDLAYEAPSLIYTVIADNGKPFVVHSCHFLPPTKGLSGIDYGTDDVARDDRPPQTGKLMFMGPNDLSNMPVIRR